MKRAGDFDGREDSAPTGYRHRLFNGTETMFVDAHLDACYLIEAEWQINVNNERFGHSEWLCVDGCPASVGEGK
jgi:hypothetical protein